MEFSPGFEPEFAFPPDFSVVGSTNGMAIIYPSAKALEELQAIIDFFFCRPVADYLAMPDQEYCQLISRAQTEIAQRKIDQKLAIDDQLILGRILNSGQLVLQSLHLRAARPKMSQQIQEVVSWHREGFYNIAGNYMVNFWVPLANVNASTALQYVPESHLIPNGEVKVETTKDLRIGKTAQNIGLVEDLKKIVSGVDLSKAEPMVVLPGEAVVFHGAMVHGMGDNYSDKIRFSIDFRVFSKYNMEVMKEKLRLVGERNKKLAMAGAA